MMALSAVAPRGVGGDDAIIEGFGLDNRVGSKVQRVLNLPLPPARIFYPRAKQNRSTLALSFPSRNGPTARIT